MKAMKPRLLLGLLFIAMFAGCVVQTIEPLFTEKEFIPYPALVGTWTDEDKKEVWTFTEDHGRYECIQIDDKGHEATFRVGVGKIGANVFLDSSVNDAGDDALNFVADLHLVPTHLFAKVVKTNDALLLIGMDGDWLQKYLEKNPKAIAHVQNESWRQPILTASSADLKKFVAKFADNENVFNPKNGVKLVRKNAGN